MCLTRKAHFSEIGGFDSMLRSGQDWDLWIKLCDHGRILVCEQPLVRYRSHDGERITSNSLSVYQGRRRIYRRYMLSMTEATRMLHLTELIYCRKVALTSQIFQRLIGLIFVVRLAGPVGGSRYVYRYLRSLFMRGVSGG